MKVKNTEISVTTANNVYLSTVVRVYAAAQATITLKSGVTTIGSFTLGAGQSEVIRKQTTDTLEATAAVLCVPVSLD